MIDLNKHKLKLDYPCSWVYKVVVVETVNVKKVIKEVWLENDELFKIFLTNYYDFENKMLNEKYRLKQIVLQLYEDLEKKKYICI